MDRILKAVAEITPSLLLLALILALIFANLVLEVSLLVLWSLGLAPGWMVWFL
jgi:hypothetical protein